MYQNYDMNQVVLPLELEVNIPENDIVMAVNGLVESVSEDIYLKRKQDDLPIIPK